MSWISLLPSTLGPVSQELGLSLVRQRVIEELIEHFERHRGDVSSKPRSFDYVNRMAQARRQNFRFPIVVLIDLDDVLQQDQSVLADIVETAEKRTDKSGAGFCREDCLGRREAQRDVDANTFV